MNRYLMAGVGALAGVALFEAAVPAAIVGGAALLAPSYLPRLWRGTRRMVKPAVRRQAKPPAVSVDRPDANVVSLGSGRFAVKQAVAKTITFRLIVTTLDFTSNYIVLGEFATAAGLSTFALVAGPVFYFVHETTWNYLGPSGTAVSLPPLSTFVNKGETTSESGKRVRIGRPLAKTITYRVIATAMDFTTTLIVVGDLATAAGLSAFGFVLGPFVYWGHEAVWDRYTSNDEGTGRPADNKAGDVQLLAPAEASPA